jgi:hypothetical protein
MKLVRALRLRSLGALLRNFPFLVRPLPFKGVDRTLSMCCDMQHQ